MLAAMKPGSVVVDLAAENGGNCVATVPGQLVEHNGVTVIGLSKLEPDLDLSNCSQDILIFHLDFQHNHPHYIPIILPNSFFQWHQKRNTSELT